MGKRLITQRRGRGTTTYKAPSHRYTGTIKYRPLDEIEKEGVIYGTVKDLIDCPGHSAPLVLVKYEKESILVSAPLGLKVNDVIAAGATAPVQKGNTLPLQNIPDGTLVYNIELRPGDGGKLVRTSGSYAKVFGKAGEKIIIILPSKKQKKLEGRCRATVGVIAGGGAKEKPILKAGKKMHAMRARNKLYPKTSGVAMNAVDHPFGGSKSNSKNKPRQTSKHAPPGRKVGSLSPKRTGKKR